VRKRWVRITAGVLALLVLLLVAATFLIEKPLRGYMEREVNRRLDGYTVSIGRLDLHPIGFSVDYDDIVVVQDAHPDPPIARIARLSAGLHWRALLRGKLVAHFLVDTPVVHANLAHLRREAADEVPVEQRGWQDAVRALYPFEINRFEIRDGQVTYVDQGPFKPLRLTNLQFVATNVRNIESRDRVYPSTLRAEAVVFDRGKLLVDGNADFLAEPHLGVLAKIRLDEIELDYFAPILKRYRVHVRGGEVSVAGDAEYGPVMKAVHIEEATVRGASIDYTHVAPAAGAEKRAVRTAARTAEDVANRPELEFKVDRLRVVGGEFGLVNEAANPRYRVFLTKTDLKLENLSNHFTDGPARVQLAGAFMGSGTTKATGTFRSDLNGPDFDLNVQVIDTDMRAMNDLLRAYEKFDVVGGLFSLYSELGVKNRVVTGYVKPLFRNLDAYDRRQDREKGVFRKLYERLVEGVGKLLENVPRDEVATKADIQGRIDEPRTSTMQVLVRLVQNAFFRAILPGFDQEVGRGRR
jgi:hypothetical protein